MLHAASASIAENSPTLLWSEVNEESFGLIWSGVEVPEATATIPRC